MLAAKSVMQAEPIRTGGLQAAFLDRDGVINCDHGYVYRREEFEFLPGAIVGMRRLVRAGFALIVVTNQSGIARGYYDAADFESLTGWMLNELAQAGAPVLAVYHCPHHPDGVVPGLATPCNCRKPAPGMLLRARDEHRIDMARSILIGDRVSDMAAARAAGVGRAFRLAPPGTDAAGAEAVLPDLPACAARLEEPGT
ncbi:D-glycero-beta-D-manno-heptose 1,7-bisphosphate 7-phosphatase [Roseinatronobacter sp.]|uniref:D-glycero-beta-D-manno-heptose 1,7-bisphosphate 7-phosphatase n=1 Tax=Roseinatronobacter sp. TaxID=1945755 RepID=UPI0025D5C7A8|nr:D-glycero-beta-D-manno-heptose 1,7-bisphosphate 7-phosphatase [Roseibaca sp.]